MLGNLRSRAAPEEPATNCKQTAGRDLTNQPTVLQQSSRAKLVMVPGVVSKKTLRHKERDRTKKSTEHFRANHSQHTYVLQHSSSKEQRPLPELTKMGGPRPVSRDQVRLERVVKGPGNQDKSAEINFIHSEIYLTLEDI